MRRLYLILLMVFALGEARSQTVDIPLFTRENTSQGSVVKISRSGLLFEGKLSSVYFDGTDSGKYDIVSYKMSMFAKATKPIMDIENAKDEFSRDVIEAIKRAPVNAKLFFEYIRATTPAHTEKQNMPPITVIITGE